MNKLLKLNKVGKQNPNIKPKALFYNESASLNESLFAISEQLESEVLSQIIHSTNQNESASKSDSVLVFWDQSSIQNVSMFKIKTTYGQRSVESVSIHTEQNTQTGIEADVIQDLFTYVFDEAQ
ncbi:Hypothetical_protein [Hexamita inflata]|uniref:Hypothetical_protein n=1 Tax=Hexamita inflata TaxID=28002 RepID=A0AA86PYP4_9EUKA|nr:Hypothetical protein HINF_LOCUS33923 [Hexamita inflata]CAI9946285.1 Hypothetical protein HINF_LOCUS33930 [Hexamita inflata]